MTVVQCRDGPTRDAMYWFESSSSPKYTRNRQSCSLQCPVGNALRYRKISVTCNRNHGTAIQQDGTRWCGMCRRFRLVTEFRTKTQKHVGQRPYSYCKECVSHANRLLKYGLSLRDFQNKRSGQRYRCWICLRGESECGSKGLCQDHCHKGFYNRDLLCVNCNSGNCQDDPELLEKKAMYIRMWTEVFKEPMVKDSGVSEAA